MLEAAQVRVTVYAPKPRAKHWPLETSEQFAAIAKLYVELAKVR